VVPDHSLSHHPYYLVELHCWEITINHKITKTQRTRYPISPTHQQTLASRTITAAAASIKIIGTTGGGGIPQEYWQDARP
jgi:carbamate kinase